jgi:hypothetical protein
MGRIPRRAAIASEISQDVPGRNPGTRESPSRLQKIFCRGEVVKSASTMASTSPGAFIRPEFHNRTDGDK